MDNKNETLIINLRKLYEQYGYTKISLPTFQDTDIKNEYKDLIKNKKIYDLNEFCFNILDKEYNGDERTYYNIVSDLKVNADEFSY